ncbi:hypothetical protein [Gallaecimonas xiamenensis]|uniref:Uncharacterized protein n=1 Tax=Gallaecimonas xiamenensis 3-C-1 TaxID=745411 RepID=K2JJH3_9GAMM|nr:hypothetical protein [Gallaecimonas xiamenensis]EKE75478.1 hypothetical protein B3C1_07369 [Gallaecimonas xiamenensis 3-C-1]
MSERLRLLTEYQSLWASPPAAWKDDYPVLYHLVQQEARHPLLHQNQVRPTPFLDELPWLPRLNRQLCAENAPFDDLTEAVRPLLPSQPKVLVEWGTVLPEVLEGFEAVAIAPSAGQPHPRRQWFEADLNSNEALDPIKGRRQLLGLGLGLEEAQQLLQKGAERRLPAMVLGISGYHLINTSSYQPLALDLPDIPMSSLRTLSMTTQEAAKDWPNRLLRWLFRPALRQAILDDLASFARKEGYQVAIQPLPPIQGRQVHALLLTQPDLNR